MRILLIGLFLLSCINTETKLTREDLQSLGKKVSPDFVYMIPTGIATKLVDCELYIPRCKIGYRIKVKLLEFNALEYDSYEEAQTSAKSFNGYHTHNWAFDYVKGEPILERFVKDAFKAKEVK